MSSHEDEIERRDIRIAKLAAQTGVLENQLWSLREQLARAQRDRGALSGLVRAALRDTAISGQYADLARRVLAEVDAHREKADRPCTFGRGHRAPGA